MHRPFAARDGSSVPGRVFLRAVQYPDYRCAKFRNLRRQPPKCEAGAACNRKHPTGRTAIPSVRHLRPDTTDEAPPDGLMRKPCSIFVTA